MSATERYGYDLTGDLVRAAQELDAAFAGAWAPRLKGHVKATRTFAYFGGPALQPDGTIDWIVDGTVVCPDGALSLVQREPVSGMVVAVTPAALVPGYRPMAVVRCAGGLLTRFVDCRDAVLGTGAQYLDELLDVSLYDLQDGDGFRYDAGSGLWVNVPAGTGGGVDVEDEGIPVVTAAGTINFVGAGVEVTDVGGVPTVEVLAAPGPGGGVLDFPESLPAVPTAYDEEGAEGSLNARWTEITAPDASYTKEYNRHGTYLVLSGPGHASNLWSLRQAIDNADGDYPTALTVTSKLTIAALNTGIQFYLSLSNNATLATGNFLSLGFYIPSGPSGNNFFTVNDGAFVELAFPSFTRTMYFHYQRNTAATNNVRVYVSADGVGMTRLFIATKTTNVDYLWLVFGAGTATQPSALWCDWIRVNDPRFLQPE